MINDHLNALNSLTNKKTLLASPALISEKAFGCQDNQLEQIILIHVHDELKSKPTR
jgi:hypothetical protein